ncbi:MAG: endonuclease/exonuclease/phosphatase family protein [Kiloniellaceae bacterium]
MIFVSYNIQWGKGKDGRVDLGRIAAELEGADVIALQEVDRFWARSGAVDQAAEIARHFPDHHWAYGPGIDLDASFRDDAGRLVGRRRQFGNMLLSRRPILSSRNHLLPKMHLDEALSLQRSALEAVTQAPSGPLRVYSVHLGHRSIPERLAQIGRLLDIVAGAPGEGGAWSGRRFDPVWALDGAQPPMPHPAVVLGDFNCTSDSAEYRSLCGAAGPGAGRKAGAECLTDAWIATGNNRADGWTCEEDGARVRIDYALVTADLAGKLRTMRVDHDAQGSDHQPIWLAIGL